MIFVFGVDNEDLGANHHGAKGLKLDSKGFAGAGLGEDGHVGVFKGEAVEDDEAVVMHVDAVENAGILGEVGGSEGERGGNGAGVHVAANLQLVGSLGHN